MPIKENLLTQIHWARAEAQAGNCAEASAQASSADQLLLSLDLPPDAGIRQQLDAMQSMVNACTPSSISDLPELPVFPEWTQIGNGPNPFDPYDPTAPLFPFLTPEDPVWSVEAVMPTESPVVEDFLTPFPD